MTAGRFPAVRVVTLTPSPTLDRCYSLGHTELGEVNRATGVSVRVAGGGVNVTQSLAAAGLPSAMVLPWSADSGTAPAGAVPVPVGSALRVNTILADRDGRTTNINQAPGRLRDGEWTALVHATLTTARTRCAEWIVVGGSLPLLTDEGSAAIARLLAGARELGVGVAVDVPGSYLPPFLISPSRAPALIKLNRAELEQVAGSPVDTRERVQAAARTLCDRGVAMVLVSLGADGVELVTSETRFTARRVAPAVVDTTGAGDAALAGFVSAVSADARTWTAETLGAATDRAAAWGAATVGVQGSVAPSLMIELDRPSSVPVVVPQ